MVAGHVLCDARNPQPQQVRSGSLAQESAPRIGNVMVVCAGSDTRHGVPANVHSSRRRTRRAPTPEIPLGPDVDGPSSVTGGGSRSAR